MSGSVLAAGPTACSQVVPAPDSTLLASKQWHPSIVCSLMCADGASNSDNTPSHVEVAVYYLYGERSGSGKKLVATFGSEQQAQAYVRWATLAENPDQTFTFEQGSGLTAFNQYEISATPLTDDPADDVRHNPTPSML